LIGLVISLLLAISWVGSAQFSQIANTGNQEKFNSPYFTTWFSTLWMIFCYPGYLLFSVLKPRRYQIKTAEIFRESRNIFGDKGITVGQVFYGVLPFNIVWILTNYVYVFSLTYISATEASAILSSNVAFVYVMALFILNGQIFVIRIVSSLICIGGVVLFYYAIDQFGANTIISDDNSTNVSYETTAVPDSGSVASSDQLVGILLALAAAFGSALYKVCFKRAVGNASLGQVSLFLSLLGLCNATILWVPALVLNLTGVEIAEPGYIPWEFLCGSSVLSLVFNFLINFGVAYTYPLFISIALMLGIPINAGVDILFRGEEFSLLQLSAALLIIVGFCFMMFPDEWNLPIHSLTRRLCCKIPRCYYGDEINNDDESDYIGGKKLEDADAL